MGTIKIDFNGNQNVGLFSYTTDNKTLIGSGYGYEKNKERIEKALGTECHEINITGIPLIGVMISGYKDKIIVPKETYPEEIEKLKEIGFKVKKIDSNYNALRNNVIVFDSGILVRNDLEEKAVKQIKDFFKKKVLRKKIKGFDAIGQMFVRNDNGIMASPHLEGNDIEAIEKFLETEIKIGTINFGGGYINSGVLVNNKGLVVGPKSSGYEIMEIESGLGFTKYD